MLTYFYILNFHDSIFAKKRRLYQKPTSSFLLDFGLFIILSFFFLFPLQAPESYKNVTDVVNTCHDAGISKKAIKLRPIAVIKG